MRRSRQEDFIEPEGDRGKRRARSNYCTGERDGILAQKIDGLRPVSEAVSQIHFEKRASPYRVSMHSPRAHRFAARRIVFALNDAYQSPLLFQVVDINHQPLN